VPMGDRLYIIGRILSNDLCCNMLDEKVDIELIVKVTGLTKEKIEEIKTTNL